MMTKSYSWMRLTLAALALGALATLALACNNANAADAPAATDTPPAEDWMQGFINIDTDAHTADLPFEIESVWSAQEYLGGLIGGPLRASIRGALQTTIASFAEMVDLQTQDVVLVDFVIANPASASADLNLIANLENSQFVLTNAAGERFVTNTWVESPAPNTDNADISGWLPFQSFFQSAGAAFIQNMNVTENLIVHGRDEGSADFYEEPLTLQPGERYQVWLSYFAPIDSGPFTLRFNDGTDEHAIPLYVN